MPIEFSDHAKKQLKLRNISQRLAVETVSDPMAKVSTFKGRKLRQKAFGDKILQVITITEGSRITVITCYYLRRK